MRPRVDMALMGWVRVRMCQIHYMMSGLAPKVPANEFRNGRIVWTPAFRSEWIVPDSV